MAIVAHELSHVLLNALRHPGRNNEVYTDLVPIVLGFGEIVREGRTALRGPTVTLYGYLPLLQLAIAERYVLRILRRYQSQRAHCLRLAALVRARLQAAGDGLLCFRSYLADIDGRRLPSMRADTAAIVVRCNAPGYTSEWEGAIERHRRSVHEAETSAQPLSLYTMAIGQHLSAQIRRLGSAAAELDQLVEEIRQDLGVLRSCVGLPARVLGHLRRTGSMVRGNRGAPGG